MVGHGLLRMTTIKDMYRQTDGLMLMEKELTKSGAFICLLCGRYSNMLERKASLKHDEAVQGAMQW